MSWFPENEFTFVTQKVPKRKKKKKILYPAASIA